MALKSDFLNEASKRGFIAQCTDIEGLDSLLCKEKIKGYIGFDCTAPSLHVGSLVQIMLLRLFQKTGNTPFVLLGGRTPRIGDPSGKDESRRILPESEIRENLTNLRQVFYNFLRFGNSITDAVFVNNADWLDKLSYIDILRDLGPHFTINRLLGFDSVKSRLEREQPLTFLEFNYSILQSYDFRELHRRHRACLQMGGSDQWGNIVCGVELARKTDKATIFGLTSPLITLASGKKMGKTVQGAVWLTENLLTPYDYWQFWRNVEDVDVGRFLRLFTDLDLREIEKLEKLRGSEINEAKKILATEATAIAHGREISEKIEKEAKQVFEQGEKPKDLSVIFLSEKQIKREISALNLLVETKLASSKSDVRRLIEQRGIKVNGNLLEKENILFKREDFYGEGLLVALGKKRRFSVKISAEDIAKENEENRVR